MYLHISNTMNKLLVIFAILTCAYAQNDYQLVIDGVKYENWPKEFVPFEKIDPSPISQLSEFTRQMGSRSNKAGISAIINIFADKVFGNISKVMVKNNMDPFGMPAIHANFSHKILFINYHGELDLTAGSLNGLSTMFRGGNVEVSYSTSQKYLQVAVPINFKVMEFEYDYSVKFMNIGPKGGIEGSISKVRAFVVLGFDCVNYLAYVDQFEIINSGHIDFKFTGNILVDWLLNLLTDLVTALLKGVILDIIQGVIGGTLNVVVDGINSLLGAILHHNGTEIGTFVAEMVAQNKFIL